MITVFPNKLNFNPKLTSTSSRVLSNGDAPLSAYSESESASSHYVAAAPPLQAADLLQPYFERYNEVDPAVLTDLKTTSMVVHVKSADEFYVQIKESSEVLGVLLQKLNDFYAIIDENKDSSYNLTSFEIDTPCVVRFSEDNVFYRAKVKTYCGKRQLLSVNFVDYGNDEMCPATDAKFLCKKFADIPALAIRCKVADFEKNASSAMISFVQLQSIADIVKCRLIGLEGEKVSTLFRNRNRRDGAWLVDLLNESMSCIPKLFFEKFAPKMATFQQQSFRISPPAVTNGRVLSPTQLPGPSYAANGQSLLKPIEFPAPPKGYASSAASVSSASDVKEFRFRYPDLPIYADNTVDGTYTKVKLVEFVSYDEFYLTTERVYDGLNKYETGLCKFYNDRRANTQPIPLTEISPKMSCVAVYSGRWFRCETLDPAFDEAGLVVLHRVDYGDKISAPVSAIYPVLEFSKITEEPRATVCCVLKDVCANRHIDVNVKNILEFMESLSLMPCTFYGLDQRGRYVVDIHLKNESTVSDHFIKTGALRPYKTQYVNHQVGMSSPASFQN